MQLNLGLFFWPKLNHGLTIEYVDKYIKITTNLYIWESANNKKDKI
jgi:hypothetical protein